VNFLPISQDVGTDWESTDERTAGERDHIAIDPHATTGPDAFVDVRKAGHRPLQCRPTWGLEESTYGREPLQLNDPFLARSVTVARNTVRPSVCPTDTSQD